MNESPGGMDLAAVILIPEIDAKSEKRLSAAPWIKCDNRVKVWRNPVILSFIFPFNVQYNFSW
jgi:hypothetical protein